MIVEIKPETLTLSAIKNEVIFWNSPYGKYRARIVVVGLPGYQFMLGSAWYFTNDGYMQCLHRHKTFDAADLCGEKMKRIIKNSLTTTCESCGKPVLILFNSCTFCQEDLINPLEYEFIFDCLGRVLKWQSFYKWYTTNITELNNRTPFEALKAGDFEAVRKLVKSYLEPLEYT